MDKFPESINDLHTVALRSSMNEIYRNSSTEDYLNVFVSFETKLLGNIVWINIIDIKKIWYSISRQL